MWNSINSQIKKRIAAMPEGAVFALSDFADLAEPKTVSKTLTRLEKKECVTKIMRGIFRKAGPRNENVSPDAIARALARSNCWQLVPSGDTAMHLIGANTQTPKVWTYVTDGTSRTYEYGGIIIRFRHASGRFMKSMSEKSALLVQVIKHWGQNPIPAELREVILSYFHASEYERVIEETKNTTVWIFRAVCSLFGKKRSAKAEI